MNVYTYVLAVFLIVRHLDGTGEGDLCAGLEPLGRQLLLPVLLARQVVTVHGDFDVLSKGGVEHFVEGFLVGGSEPTRNSEVMDCSAHSERVGRTKLEDILANVVW